jgi:hypothetical protein
MTTTIDCYVVAYKPVEVTAGAFQASECECQCTHLDGGSELGCGQRTIWYAPAVKNVIKLKTESTATSMELIECKASRPTPSAKVAQEKIAVPPESKIAPDALSSMESKSEPEPSSRRILRVSE